MFDYGDYLLQKLGNKLGVSCRCSPVGTTRCSAVIRTVICCRCS